MKPPHERPMRPNATLYSPAAGGKLPSPEWEGQTKNLSVHPSTEPGQLHYRKLKPGSGLSDDSTCISCASIVINCC